LERAIYFAAAAGAPEAPSMDDPDPAHRIDRGT
jgi:hypothetical protein